MAIPDLVFPNLAVVPIDAIWEAIKAIIRNDANLKTLRSIKLWEGNVDDAAPPTAGEMPWLRVTPMGSKMAQGDEASWLTDIPFKYEMAVEGTSIRNLFRVDQAFRQAFNYNARTGVGRTVMTDIRDAQAVVHTFSLAAIGPLRVRDVEPDPMTGQYPVQNLAASGLFSVRAYLPAIS